MATPAAFIAELEVGRRNDLGPASTLPLLLPRAPARPPGLVTPSVGGPLPGVAWAGCFLGAWVAWVASRFSSSWL